MLTFCQLVLQGRRMNFRQRMAWLFLAIFLIASVALTYYIFEISDQYNTLALEHTQNYDNLLLKKPNEITLLESLKLRLVTMPFWVWMIIFLIPYLQVFCLLWACTKNDPMNASVMVSPLFVCLRMRSSTSKAHNCLNGTNMMHT